MRLSIFTLRKFLVQKGLNPASLISGEKSGASGVRITERASGGVEYAEIIPSDDKNFKVAIAFGADRLYIPRASIAEVFNCLMSAFDFYNEWEREMLLCIVEKRTLQELLDAAARVFERPMFIKGDSSWVYAITRGYGDETHPNWNQLVNSADSHDASFDAVRAVSLDPEFREVFTRKHPVIVRSPLYGGMILRATVHLDERMVCEVVTLENDLPFDPGDVVLMEVFTGVVKQYISNNREQYFSYSDMTSFFVKLIETGECDEVNLPAVYRSAGWSARDEFAVAAVEGKSRYETPILGVLRERLDQQLKSAATFSHGGRIICIINISACTGYEELVGQLGGIIPPEAFSWGISYEFGGLENTPVYYAQALAALESALDGDSDYYTMYNIACGRIAQKLREADLKSLVHPALVKLSDNEKYTRTLFEFLLCGGNYTDTAARLGLHRNSLIYRMQKISEILGCSLDSPENRKLLLYSFMLLGY